MPGDKNHTPRPGGRHMIVCIEQDAPGCYEIRCACGESTWTPWGADAAGEIGEMHMYAVGVTPRTVWR